MKHYIRNLFIICVMIFISSCSEEIKNINIELKDNPEARHILAPGMGTLGLIQDNQLYVFFLNEEHRWIMDKTSQFNIPEDNDGLIALGMGNIGVIKDDQMHVYRLDQENKWKKEDQYTFTLPRRYQKMLAVKMPWEMGIMAFEMNGFLEFYYYSENSGWRHDETASFRIPSGIDSYFSMGNMTVAVTQGNKLGLYYLHPEGDWRFLDQENFILKLPPQYKAVIPYEPGTIALLRDNVLNFYQLDLENQRWVSDESMDFYIINQ